jgi:hypothetical protein
MRVVSALVSGWGAIGELRECKFFGFGEWVSGGRDEIALSIFDFASNVPFLDVGSRA